MSIQSINTQHLNLRSAQDVHEIFGLLGYPVDPPYAYEGDDLDAFEFDPADRANVQRVYIVSQVNNHTVYLMEVNDLRQTRLRGLAHNLLQRGTALMVVTRDYRDILFVDPRYAAGKNTKSSVRVNKLRLVTGDPTRHDADTLNAVHAHRRTGQQIYDAQAEAFNVTTITNKFYQEYRRHYDHARAVIKRHNLGVREFQDSDKTDKLHAFTQRLLGRLMFLYFLQRKGWLGGKQKFLTEMFARTQRDHAGEAGNDGETFHYYREVLEPLFFKTLNTKRMGNVTQWAGVFIPYLNGGLFDESRDPAGPIILPDSLFDPNSNDGLLAFFNRYNFTITDDTPMEQDVAVDPEMLGKVFENMLEERDRGQSGSFYTVRSIVSYMCQESLAGYLEESAGVSRETTRAQFDPDSPVRYTLDEAASVNTALDSLTVLDPAVGSGSFLIGMLGEIIWLRRVCYIAQHGESDIPTNIIADWKEAIIRDTLYGVDIKPEAIEIAQLRLWLALVVDQTVEQARPLPNLDYKLMAGNSLIETIDGEPILGEQAQAMLSETVAPKQLGLFESAAESERFKLDELRQQFFRAAPDERKRLRADITYQERRIVEVSLNEKTDLLDGQIRELGAKAGRQNGTLNATDQRKLKAATDKLTRLTALQQDMNKPDHVPPFFLYRLHFSEVFERKKGFDIVVANPPYVRGELLGDQKPELQATYPKVYKGTADLYVYFFARAYNLLRSDGQLAFITSNKYLRASYGKGLRKFLSENVRLRALMDFGDLPVFDAAAYPCIVLADKYVEPSNQIPAASVRRMDDLEDLYGALGRGVRLKQAELGESEWQIASADVQRVFAKLKAVGTPLGEYVGGKIYRGIVTGFNDAFVIDEAKRSELIEADPNSAEVIKPWLRGRDVKRWKATSQQLYLVFIRPKTQIDKYPAILEHLGKFKQQLQQKAGANEWYELQTNVAYYKAFHTAKIIYPDITKLPAFTMDYDNYYTSDTTFLIPIEDYFLLATLNSHVTTYCFIQISSIVRGGFFRFKNIYVKQLPIPNPPDTLREQIAALARQCLAAAQSAPDSLPALESQLNALVYQAYGLDEDDIRVIESAVGGAASASGDDVESGDEGEGE